LIVCQSFNQPKPFGIHLKWDMESFQSTIEKYRQVKFDSICMAHFGYIHRDEVKGILDEAAANFDTWWELYDRNADRLDDIDYMVEKD